MAGRPKDGALRIISLGVLWLPLIANAIELPIVPYARLRDVCELEFQSTGTLEGKRVFLKSLMSLANPGRLRELDKMARILGEAGVGPEYFGLTVDNHGEYGQIFGWLEEFEVIYLDAVDALEVPTLSEIVRNDLVRALAVLDAHAIAAHDFQFMLVRDGRAKIIDYDEFKLGNHEVVSLVNSRLRRLLRLTAPP